MGGRSGPFDAGHEVGAVAEGLRERFAGLDRKEQVGVAAVAAVVVAAAVVWYVRSLPSAVQIQESSGGTRPAAPVASSSPSPASAEVVVDVAGRVRDPGVYTLQQGDRVIDAIRRAGGPLPGADLASINLAALLTDAEQIVVGRAGGGRGPPSGTTTGSSGGATSPGSPGAKVNVNTATLDELESLPGIGQVIGQRIVDFRQQHGPFRTVDDLLNVSGIGPATMAELRPLVTV